MSEHQFEKIEQLIDQTKFKEALKELEILESSEQLTTTESLTLKYLKSTLFLKLGNFKDGKLIATQLLEDSIEVGNHPLEFDALINTIWALQYLGRVNDGLQLKKRGEKLLELLVQDQQSGLKAREATLLHRKGSLLLALGNLDQALNFLEKSLSLREEVEDKKSITESMGKLGDFTWIKVNWIKHKISLRKA